MLLVPIGIANEATTYVTENKETIFKFKLKDSFMSIKHIKLLISSIIPVAIPYIYLDDSFISKFDFMNYLFAKPSSLVVAWLDLKKYFCFIYQWKYVNTQMFIFVL